MGVVAGWLYCCGWHWCHSCRDFAGGMETAALSYGVSAVTEVLKWFTAICLVVIAFFYTEGTRGLPLLAGQCSMPLLWQQTGSGPYMIPLSADGSRNGAVPFWLACLGVIFVAGAYRRLPDAADLRGAVRQMELRLMMQKEHYEKLTGALEEASRTRHDMRQYIRTASHAAGRGIMNSFGSISISLQRRAVRKCRRLCATAKTCPWMPSCTIMQASWKMQE